MIPAPQTPSVESWQFLVLLLWVYAAYALAGYTASEEVRPTGSFGVRQRVGDQTPAERTIR